MVMRRAALHALDILFAAGVVMLVSSSVGADDEKKQCAEAYERTQVLRLERKLIGARDAALRCAQEACPASAKVDCSKWLVEIESSMPTVVVEARDSQGQETFDVRVLCDGVVLAERLDGAATAVDPGVHTMRYQSRGRTTEESIVVREGEKNRKLLVRLPALLPPPSPREKSAPTRVSPAVFVLGGIGLVALGAFTYFGLRSLDDWNELDETCAPDCAQDDVDALATKELVADVSLGVGIAALGAATILYVVGASGRGANRSKAAVSVDVAGPRRQPSWGLRLRF
jgi:hypothetical protein